MKNDKATGCCEKCYIRCVRGSCGRIDGSPCGRDEGCRCECHYKDFKECSNLHCDCHKEVKTDSGDNTVEEIVREFEKQDTPWSFDTRNRQINWLRTALHFYGDKIERAYGGCKFCYGKGYSTQIENYSGYGESDIGQRDIVINEAAPYYLPCKKCDRGLQIKILTDKIREEAVEEILRGKMKGVSPLSSQKKKKI